MTSIMDGLQISSKLTLPHLEKPYNKGAKIFTFPSRKTQLFQAFNPCFQNSDSLCTCWWLGSNLQDELVGGRSLLVGDGQLVLLAHVLLLQVVDRQSDWVFTGKVLKSKPSFTLFFEYFSFYFSDEFACKEVTPFLIKLF